MLLVAGELLLPAFGHMTNNLLKYIFHRLSFFFLLFVRNPSTFCCSGAEQWNVPHCPRRHFLNVVRLKAAPWKFSTLKVVSHPNNQPANPPSSEAQQLLLQQQLFLFFLFLLLLPFGMTKICAVYLSSLQVVLTCFRCIILRYDGNVHLFASSLAMCIRGGWRWTKVGVHICADVCVCVCASFLRPRNVSLCIFACLVRNAFQDFVFNFILRHRRRHLVSWYIFFDALKWVLLLRHEEQIFSQYCHRLNVDMGAWIQGIYSWILQCVVTNFWKIWKIWLKGFSSNWRAI